MNKIYIKKSWNHPSIDESTPFIEDGKLYRKIPQNSLEECRAAILGGLTIKLAKMGLLPEHTIVLDGTHLEVDYFPWCVLSSEYCKLQLRDGLINTIKLHLELGKHDLGLLDPNRKQLGMKYSNLPVYIDFGSIGRPSTICQKEKILLFCSDFGYTKIHNTDKELLRAVESFTPTVNGDLWTNYNKRPNRILKIGQNPELDFIAEWLMKYEPKNVLDIGANKGRIATFCSHRLNIPVLACDTSEACVEYLYTFAKDNSLNITSLLWDIMKPPRLSGYSQVKCEALIASSVSHHLFKAGYSFAQQAGVFDKVATNLMLVEYIDKSDQHTKKWPVKWTKQQFEEAFKNLGWDIVHSEPIEFPSRIWYVFERK